MTNAPATARVRVAVPGDDATLERAAQQLRAELLDLEVESVHRATVGDAPPGAKAVEAIELGTFLVTLVTSGALLEQVVGLLRSEGFLAVASMGSGDDDGDEGAVWTSSDGERWERQDTTVFRGGVQLTAATASSDRVVVTGRRAPQDAVGAIAWAAPLR